MIIITGTIKVQSIEELNRVKAILIHRAKQSRADQGNIAYVFAQNIEDPTELMLTEKWVDETSLQAHLNKTDEEFTKIMGSALIDRAVVTAHEVTTERTLLKR